MEHTFNIAVIAARIIEGFCGLDLPKKLEEAQKLPHPLTPYSTGDNAEVIHLDAEAVAQLLPGLLRAAYKRLAYTFASTAPLAGATEGMSSIEIKMRDALAAKNAEKNLKPGNLQAEQEAIDQIVDGVDTTDSLFESVSPDQDSLSEDSYRPDREQAEYDVAVLESVQLHLARNYKGGRFAYLLDGITKNEMRDGKIVAVTSYPCPANIQQWRSSTAEFIAARMIETHSTQVGSLLKGISEMGAGYSTPLYSGDTQALALDFQAHWTTIGKDHTETAGEKFAFAFFGAVENNDQMRAVGALKKWEVMLASAGALKLFDELVTSEHWDDACTSKYERDLERANNRGAVSLKRARRDRRIKLLEQGICGSDADRMLDEEDAKAAADKALANAASTPAPTPPTTPAASDEPYKAAPARTVGPKPEPVHAGQKAAGKNTGVVRKGKK
jgi:hypothetical protein